MSRRDAANAVTRTVTDYGVDTRAVSIIGALTGEIGARLAGHGGAVFVGDKGDPTQRFDGYVAGAQQHFTGAAAHVGTGSTFRDAQGRTIETSFPDSTITDPARRMFADRLRRRVS